MATAIFREWFVHYRFPGHADVETRETEIGEVPTEWEVRDLKDVCTLTLGTSPKSKYYNEEGEGLPFHQGVRDFGSRFPEHTRHCSKKKRVAEKGDILFSVRAPVGRINIADRRMVIGRGLHAIRSTTGHQWFIFHQLRAKFFEENLMGSGTVFKSVTKKDMLNLNLLIPPEGLRDQFEETVRPIEDLIVNLTFKNRNLRETRDLLLPRLVTGEIDVEEFSDLQTTPFEDQTQTG
jgi:type I restriction enzyme S subunit